MADVNRDRRVNALMQRELGDFIEKYVASDLTCLVTITKVKTAPDLHNAIVYVSFLGGDEEVQKKAMRRLHKERPAMQRAVNRDMKLKYTPVLEFRRDDTQEKGDHILGVLDELGL